MQNKSKIKYVASVGFIILGLIITMNACGKKPVRMENDDIIEMLCKTPIHYSNDGGGSSDLMSKINLKTLSNYNTIVPLLITNLSNPTLTESKIDNKKSVSLGYICFDVLCTIIKKSDIWFSDCNDDGLWSCVREEYHIPITINDDNLEQTKNAQNKWQELLINNRISISDTL